MLKSVLIANRGEIAVRIAATCRRLGVRTVAVFSDADADAMHVAACDTAVRIGPAATSRSYLRGDAIIAAAHETGAEAIHPGYGFLSENAEFAEAVGAAGLAWIGPPPAAIRAMGLKDAARARMQAAGVPITPGYHGAEQTPAHLAREADRIGYPVLIKARAGGGGKGMRLVERAADFAEALESASREAASSFADGAVLVEKFVATPRHIEVQVFADSFGNAVHLFERDCSLQRRHQKVIEEAPAPGMTEAMRAEMGAVAVRAAQAVGYAGAGTVEFIADASEGLRPDRFYFMEMNTRLQVEHPVTEAVCGVDLVEWQLRVAAGEALPLGQDALRLDGCAVEARLYAEDAAAGFMPATGRLRRLRFPGGLRVDAGVREGDAVTPHYDPMIAKLIAHAPTRQGALAKLAAGLDALETAGCVTNAGFLGRLLRHGEVQEGLVDTGLIARAGEALIADPAPEPVDWALAAAAALGIGVAAEGWAARDGWRSWGEALLVASFENGAVRMIRSGASWRCETPAGAIELSLTTLGDGAWRASTATRTLRAAAVVDGAAVTVLCEGRRVGFTLADPLAALEEAGDASGEVRAPMPGLVTAVHVELGGAVAKGDRVATLEAMKMEHALRAPMAGVIAALDVSAGDLVDDRAVLAVVAPA